MTDPTPKTEAGRRVRAIEYHGTGPSSADILAIEAEAAAQARAEALDVEVLAWAAKEYMNHVVSLGCDHDGSGAGTHDSCPPALALRAILAGETE